MSADARKYLAPVHAAIADAMKVVLTEKSPDPVEAIGRMLIARATPNPLADEEARKDEKPMVNAERAVELRVL